MHMQHDMMLTTLPTIAPMFELREEMNGESEGQ
jgi:hypothetical protein